MFKAYVEFLKKLNILQIIIVNCIAAVGILTIVANNLHMLASLVK